MSLDAQKIMMKFADQAIKATGNKALGNLYAKYGTKALSFGFAAAQGKAK